MGYDEAIVLLFSIVSIALVIVGSVLGTLAIYA
jgi:hypothetical protein